MEKNDYVICSWCGIDIVPDFEYSIIYNVTHNEAVDRAKQVSLQQSINNYIDFILQKTDEEIIDNFIRFEVWKIDSNISKEAWDEFDFGPDVFCNRYCERVA